MNNNIFNIINMIRMAKNPEQIMQSAINQNPQMANIISQVKNSTQGANPQQVAMQMARQKGISEKEIMDMYNFLNGKNKN